MHRKIGIVLLGLALVVPTAISAAAQVVPEDTEPAALSKPTPRGGVEAAGDASEAETHPKTVDGRIDDWIGESTNLSGTTVTDHGELIWQGFLFDDFGADDGADRERIEALGPAYKREQRAERIEAASQAADEQFGAPQAAGGTVVTPPNYGDAKYPPGAEGHADLTEVRVAADTENVYLLARFATLTDASDPALFVVTHTGQDSDQQPAEPGFNSGLIASPPSKPLYIDATGAYEAIDQPGPAGWKTAPTDGATVAVEPSGSINAIEVQIPRETITGGGEASKMSLVLASGIAATDTDGDPQLADVATGQAYVNLLDVAFRHEPAVSNWFDRGQALNLLQGNVEPYLEPVDLDALAAGTSRPVQPTPGYHQVVFRSSPDISSETLEQGPKETVLQPYGLYLPTEWDVGDERPLTTWLHYRGGTTHQAAAWIPRIVEQLGEERHPGNIMVFPRGRGTSTWYAGAAHVDVLEVLDDVQERYEIDEDRRYLAGYSMGGYGSYLFGLLYPDRFAGAYPISGAMTIGLWAGVDDEGRDTQGTNGGDGDLENTFRLVENARNLPYVIHHGTDDELVPITGVERMAAKLHQLGYQYRFYRFLGYEHFTQAVIDEWKEGARYLDDQTRTEDPARVVYKRVPALEHAIETLNSRGADIDLDTDGAYWVSGMELDETSTTDPGVSGKVDVRSHAIEDDHLLVPEAGAVAPGHSTPYVMDGQDWRTPPLEEPAVPVPPVIGTVGPVLEANLTNVAAATIDLERADVDADEAYQASVSTDTTTTLGLDGDYDEAPTVEVDGQAVAVTLEGGAIQVPLDPGEHVVEVSPEG